MPRFGHYLYFWQMGTAGTFAQGRPGCSRKSVKKPPPFQAEERLGHYPLLKPQLIPLSLFSVLKFMDND